MHGSRNTKMAVKLNLNLNWINCTIIRYNFEIPTSNWSSYVFSLWIDLFFWGKWLKSVEFSNLNCKAPFLEAAWWNRSTTTCAGHTGSPRKRNWLVIGAWSFTLYLLLWNFAIQSSSSWSDAWKYHDDCISAYFHLSGGCTIIASLFPHQNLGGGGGRSESGPHKMLTMYLPLVYII